MAMCIQFDQTRSIDIISMGRVAVDLYAEQIGATLSEAQTFRKYLGGCAGNIAVGCARLSLKASMLSCVGNDHMGVFLRDTLVHEGVDISALQVSSDHLTGLVLLGVCPPDHFPLIFYRTDCADMAIDSSLLSKDYFARAKALLITGTGLSHQKSRASTMLAVSLAKSVGCKIILDIDYRPVLWGLLSPGDGENRYVESSAVSEIFNNVLPLIDLVVGTEEECQIAGGDADFDAALTNIQDQSSAVVIVKRGVKGANAYVPHAQSIISGRAFAVPVQNVLGAGDGFMAGLLSQLLKNHPIAEALTHANACGAIVVSRHGCSPATPSREEIDYFLATHPHDPDVLTKPSISQLHQKAILKNHARRPPMPILAFCHRWQLEAECKQRQISFDRIAEFKTALVEAVVALKEAEAIKNPYILVDPTYCNQALACAQVSSIAAIVAIEKSGSRLTEWVTDSSAYEILHHRPASHGVKILWQFHRNWSELDRHHQLTRLRELARACEQLDRKLMLELIVNPAEDQEILAAIETIYQHGIYPYWWKLACFAQGQAFERCAHIINEFDRDSRIVILGGDTKDITQFSTTFSRAKSIPHTIGFAIGRAIFWPAFINFIEGRFTHNDVKADVSLRFTSLYQMFLNS